MINVKLMPGLCRKCWSSLNSFMYIVIKCNLLIARSFYWSKTSFVSKFQRASAKAIYFHIMSCNHAYLARKLFITTFMVNRRKSVKIVSHLLHI